MIKFFTVFKTVLSLTIAMMLSGCLGGTIGQQIARSIATSMADSAIANAMDVQEMDQQYKNFAPEQNVVVQKNVGLQQNTNFQQNIALQQNPALQNNPLLIETPPDPYTLAFINARFEDVKIVSEPLPMEIAAVETPLAVLQSSQLVPVELFNLLIGEEKAAVYAKAQLLGATTLPKQREWKLWRVATGMIKTNVTQSEKVKLASINDQNTGGQRIITFLIPPEFGKLPSGSIALVEIASPGELNIARYKIN
ncbi:MAG: hypothetical protein V4570_09880 [Pseudomonadota bacterium]